MMFSRAAPTVLFTAFCLAVAGVYVSGDGRELTRPGQLSAAERSAFDSYYLEIRLAYHVGDQARIEALMNSQIAALQGGAVEFAPDRLAEPAHGLRDILMDGTPDRLDAWLAAHPDFDLDAPRGGYGAVPLIWATSNANHMPAMVARLLSAGADPRGAAPTGFTMLHAMASPFHLYADAQAPDWVIAALPADMIDAPSKIGETPLHVALVNMRGDQAQALLAHGADPNRPFPRRDARDYLAGLPPLMLAAGDPVAVEALLAAGADPAAQDSAGRSILDVLSADLRAAEQDLQDRTNASAAEEYDREYVADLTRARNMIRAALDARLAQGG